MTSPMSTPLVHIPGVGPATARALRAAGFDTAESIAGANVGALTTVPGIGLVRAEMIHTSAQRLLSGAVMPAPGPVAAAPPEEAPGGAQPSAEAPTPVSKKAAKLLDEAEALTAEAKKLAKKAKGTKSKKKRKKRLNQVAEIEAAAKKARKKAKKLLSR